MSCHALIVVRVEEFHNLKPYICLMFDARHTASNKVMNNTAS